MKQFKRILMLLIIGFITLGLMGNSPTPVLYANLTLLPETEGIFNVTDESTRGNIATIDLTLNTNTGKYNAVLNYKTEVWEVRNITLETDVELKQKFSGFYWTDSHPETNELTRFVAYQTEGTTSRYDYLLTRYDMKDIEPFMGWTLWNLNTGETKTDMKMDVYGKVTEHKGVYYMDTVLGVPNDDLLAMVMEYEYRSLKKSANFLGLGEEWYSWTKRHEYIVETGQTVTVPYNVSMFRATLGLPASWWGNFGAGFVIGGTFGGAYAIKYLAHDSNIQVIQQITYNDAQKRTYVNAYNNQVDYYDNRNIPHNLEKVTVDDVFKATNYIYRIYLSAISSEEQAVQYKDFAALYVAYEYKDTIYSVATQNIRSLIVGYVPPTPGEIAEDRWAKIRDFFKKNKWYLIGAGALLFLGMVTYLAGPSIRMALTNTTKQRTKSRKIRRKTPTKKGKK